MSFAHDVIKMKYVKEGYLANWPYHLLSDEEMCDAFLPLRGHRDGVDGYYIADADWAQFLSGAYLCYFFDNYPYRVKNHCGDGLPLIDESKYRSLVTSIVYHLDQLRLTKEPEYTLPDWVYSYMLGSTLGPTSSQLDLHSMFVMLDRDNDFDEYTKEVAEECYRISESWISKLSDVDHRSPTMFGEPHILKYLRLEQQR